MDVVTGSIRRYTLIAYDHSVCRWPVLGNVDEDMVFDIENDGGFYECYADGFGRRSWIGEKGGYGCGSITVFHEDGIEWQ